jgi:hypothetical protein
MARKPPDSKWLNSLETEDQEMQTKKHITDKENRPYVNVRHTENNIGHIVQDIYTKWLSILWDKVTVRLLSIRVAEACRVQWSAESEPTTFNSR